MNYQGEITTVSAVGTVTAGVATVGASSADIAVLPNTGDVPILLYVGVAAIVTGAFLIMIQIGVWAYGRNR